MRRDVLFRMMGLLGLVWLLGATAVFADTAYTVQPGDTLYKIARQHNVSVNDIMQANGLTNPNFITVGQQLTIPDGATTTPPQTPPATTPPPQAGSHTVKQGETLFSISRLYGVTASAIAQANNISNPNRIYPGQVLVIPGGNAPAPTPSPSPTPPPTAPPTGMGTYTVRPGDTLSRIAAQFGVTVNAIMQANNISNPNRIFVGQVLNIPGGSSGGGSTPPPVSGGSLPSGFLFGGQTQTFAHPDLMRNAGMKWVKFQHKWSPGDSASVVADKINAAHSQGFKVLLSIPGAQTYPSANGIDFGAYTQFLAAVAKLSPPPDAIELWNEMNIDFEWPAGQIDPASYVQNMLAPGYNAIKAANPNILVISGAPAPTGFDNGTNAWADNRYMAGMAAAGGANYMDCIGIHFNAGATAPNAGSGHPAGTHYSWYYGAMVQTYSAAFGGARPLCFTELGYLSGDGFAGIPPNFSWASGTSLSEHAAWLAQATQMAASDGRVKMLIVFNVDFTLYQPDGDPQAGYAMLRPDGSCPACDALRGVTGGN